MLIGLVGKPNVGKSTLFKAITMQNVESANYPFTTIDPNKGYGFVRVEEVGFEFGVTPTPRYGYIKGKYRFVPVPIIDIAGLVPGAHEGKGLGNKFLDDLRQADALIHVVDIIGSTNEEGQYLGPGNYDPLKDIQWFEEELDWWFYQIISKNIDKILRKAKSTGESLIQVFSKLLSGLNIKEYHVKEAFKNLNLDPENYDLGSKVLFSLAVELRKLSKPIVIAANRIDVDPKLAKKNINRLKEQYPDYLIVPTSGYAEYILKKLDQEGKIEYIPGDSEFKIISSSLTQKEKEALNYIKNIIFEEFGSTGVQILLDKTVFEILGYIAVFPGGIDSFMDKEGRILPDCYLLPKGSTVIDFANKIHSDLAKHFIKAIDVRTKKMLSKDYILKHRDVIHIVSNS